MFRKQPLYVWLSALALLLIASFLGWAFSQHGTSGLFHVNGTFRLFFSAAGLAGLLAFLVAWFAADPFLSSRSFLRRALAVLSAVVAVPLLLLSPAAFVILSGVTSSGVGNTLPQLLMVEGSGPQGIPDLAVTFTSASVSQNTLYWGLDGAPGAAMPEPNPVREHAFVLKGLKPGGSYWYRLNEGTTYHFAAPPASGTLHFAAGGDTHYGASTQPEELTREMMAQIANPAHAFNLFFLDGDIVHNGYDASQWENAFNALSPTTSIIATRLVPGNHDTLFAGFRYTEELTYTASLPLSGGTSLWQRYDVGNIHFLSIDLEWSAETFNSAQATWLAAQLKSIPAGDWKIVIGHGYYYASGARYEGWNWWDNPETISRLAPIFEKYGVDLVFSGHAHQMELLSHNNVTYVICGGFGGVPDANPTHYSPESLWYKGNQYGFTDVTVAGKTATIVFRAPDFSELHRYTLTK